MFFGWGFWTGIGRSQAGILMESHWCSWSKECLEILVLSQSSRSLFAGDGTVPTGHCNSQQVARVIARFYQSSRTRQCSRVGCRVPVSSYWEICTVSKPSFSSPQDRRCPLELQCSLIYWVTWRDRGLSWDFGTGSCNPGSYSRCWWTPAWGDHPFWLSWTTQRTVSKSRSQENQAKTTQHWW